MSFCLDDLRSVYTGADLGFCFSSLEWSVVASVGSRGHWRPLGLVAKAYTSAKIVVKKEKINKT